MLGIQLIQQGLEFVLTWEGVKDDVEFFPNQIQSSRLADELAQQCARPQVNRLTTQRLSKESHQVEDQTMQPSRKEEGCVVELDLTVQFSLHIASGLEHLAGGQDIGSQVVTANPMGELLSPMVPLLVEQDTSIPGAVAGQQNHGPPLGGFLCLRVV
jgi:hypothetical protein